MYRFYVNHQQVEEYATFEAALQSKWMYHRGVSADIWCFEDDLHAGRLAAAYSQMHWHPSATATKEELHRFCEWQYGEVQRVTENWRRAEMERDQWRTQYSRALAREHPAHGPSPILALITGVERQDSAAICIHGQRLLQCPDCGPEAERMLSERRSAAEGIRPPIETDETHTLHLPPDDRR